MLVSAAGRERAEEQRTELVDATGFRYERATRATANSHVIEAVPV